MLCGVKMPNFRHCVLSSLPSGIRHANVHDHRLFPPLLVTTVVAWYATKINLRELPTVRILGDLYRMSMESTSASPVLRVRPPRKLAKVARFVVFRQCSTNPRGSARPPHRPRFYASPWRCSGCWNPQNACRRLCAPWELVAAIFHPDKM